MKPELKIFSTGQNLANSLCDEFFSYVSELINKKLRVNIAISGGNTPITFYRRLAVNYQLDMDIINWEKIHFYWVDERCVPPNDPDSNFGNTNINLFRKIRIPGSNIHRIRGEENPEEEAKQYELEILGSVPLRNNYPVFDWIFLGLGEDGHTASIFPDQLRILTSDKICDIGIHPVSKQKRITLTGNSIKNADRITFLISGMSKKKAVHDILNENDNAKFYPANFIKPLHGKLEWYIDKAAIGEM